MTTLSELIEQAAAGELDHADVAAFSADMAAVVVDQLAQSTEPGTAPLRAMMLRAQVADAQAKVSGLLNEADLIEHEGKLEAALAVAQAQLQAAEQVTEQARGLAEQRADDARLAAADAQAAADYAAKMRKAAGDLKMLGASPEQRTTAELRANAAADVERETADTAARAAQAHQHAERDAESAGGLVRGAQAALEAAQAAHAAAGETVRPSAFTLAIDWPRLLSKREHLTAAETTTIQGFIMAYASATGADRNIRNDAREKLRAELREETDRQMVTAARRTGGPGVLAHPLPAQSAPPITGAHGVGASLSNW